MAEKEIGIVIRAVDKATATIKKVGGNLSGRATKNEKLFKGMQTYGIAATIAIASVGTMAVRQASKMEDLRIELNTLMGSAEKGGAMMKTLLKDAAKTPFASDDLVRATSTMLQFGVAQDKVRDSLMMLGDISGGNAEKLQSLSLVFGQISSAGKLTGQDLLQLINLGFNPLKEISDTTGESMASLKDKMSKGQISFDMIQESMKRATSEGGLFYGMMEAKSKTFSGVMSTLQDNVGIALASLGGFSNGEVVKGGLLDMITQGVNKLIPYLEKIVERSSKNPTIARNILLISGAIAVLVTVIGTLGFIIPNLVKGFNGIITVVGLLSKALLFLTMNPIGLAIVAISALVVAGVLLYKNWDVVKAKAIQVWTRLGAFFSALLGGISDDFMGMVDSAYQWGANLINMLVSGVKSGYENLKKSVSDMAQVVKDYLGFGSPTKEGPNSNSDKWIPNLVNMLSKGFDDGQSKIASSVKRVAEVISKTMGKGFDTEKLKQNISSMQVSAVQLFDNLASKISQHKSNVQTLAGDYKELQNQLKNINQQIGGIQSDASNQIAQRAIAIEEERAGIQGQLADGSTKMTDKEREALNIKMMQLDAEYQLALANTSQADIAEQRRVNGLSETATIIEQTQLKLQQAQAERNAILQQMELKKKAMLYEIKEYLSLDAQKKELDKVYFSLFKTRIDEAQASVMQTINMMKELIRLQNESSSSGSSKSTSGKRAFGGTVQANKTYLVGERGPEMFTPATTGSINTNPSTGGVSIAINMGGVVVQNDADENRLVDKIRNSLAREMQLYKLGIN